MCGDCAEANDLTKAESLYPLEHASSFRDNRLGCRYSSQKNEPYTGARHDDCNIKVGRVHKHLYGLDNAKETKVASLTCV